MGCNIPRPWKRPPTPLIYHDTTTDPIIREHRTNCPNCCAPITGMFCEYCGTRFGGMDLAAEGDQVVIPVYIGQKQVDEVIKSGIPAKFLAWNPAADEKATPGTITQLR